MDYKGKARQIEEAWGWLYRDKFPSPAPDYIRLILVSRSYEILAICAL
jgi:hypothetical protein